MVAVWGRFMAFNDLELQPELSDFRSGAFARVVRFLVEPSSDKRMVFACRGADSSS